MKVTLLDHTNDPENTIGRMAAICYDAKTDRESNIKRAGHCKEKGHLSTLRFSYATFEIDHVSLACSHQIVRIAHAGILQESKRYVEKTALKFITPDSIEKSNFVAEYCHLVYECFRLYEAMISAGIKKEDSRYIMPVAWETKLNLCLNFQGWRDFLKNRTSKTAQWEVRNVALEIERQLKEIAPVIFK